MKGTKSSGATRTRDRKARARPSHGARRRATAIRLEALEERTLLSGGVATISGLGAVNPAGSLVYQGTVTGTLASSNDVATYNLAIDPHQTLAELATPTSGETLTVSVTAPDATVTTVSSASPGSTALIPAIQSPNGGTYVIKVSGGPGGFTLQSTLNALIDPSAHGGPPDNSIGTAQPLDAYANAIAGTADRTAVLGVVQSPARVYSLNLAKGQSTTIVLQSLDGQPVQFSLLDGSGSALALSSPGAQNYTAGLNNFVAPSSAPYYVKVTGPSGARFNLVATRGADFSTQPHNTAQTAQNITATQQSGDPNQGGALGDLQSPNGTPVLGTTIEGIDYNDSNSSGLPPDTSAAVSGNFIVETVNLTIRVFDKTTGSILLDEPLTTFFSGTGVPPARDSNIVYDTIANRWYVSAIDGNDNSKLQLAVSNDANPLDGFTHQYLVPLAASGHLADFPKIGYNADAIVCEANDVGDGHSVVTAVDKAKALSGILVDYQSTPSLQFGALVPAQMHGANPGDPMWFMAATGDPTFDGTHPNTIRVTEMASVLSNAPVYTDDSVSVNTYGPNSGSANQPGGIGSVATGDVTTTQVDYLNGKLVTAFSAGTPADGFQTTKAHWYEVDISMGTPKLVQQGVVDPGPGVATFFPTATQDAAGDIGITYMESSSTEYVSAYVAGHVAGTPLGTTTLGTAFAPGAGFMPGSSREGDYSTVVLDPTDGKTFWAANEYAGSDAGSDLWRTKIASFTLFPVAGTDYYSVNANAGDHLHFATTTPAGGPNEFANGFYPELLLHDQNGNLVAIASGNAADGRNSVIDFTVPVGGGGTWTIEVTASPNTPQATQGEYGLHASGATGALSAMAVTSTTPAAGALVQPPTSYTVVFDHPVYLPSATTGALTINGVPASAVSLVDDRTVTWTIPAGAIPHGNRVLDSVALSGIKDVSGATMSSFTSNFTTDDVPPFVSASSISNGASFLAPATITEVVTFSEPMNTAITSASSFNLHGVQLGADYAATSFGWSPTGTQLTIHYAALPADAYTLTLHAAGFQDLVGLPLASDYLLNFTVQNSADLSITASGPATAVAGDPNGFKYTLVVTNNGPSTATGGFTVTDVLPAGLTFVSAGSTPGTSAIGQTVSFTSTTGLAIGATQTVTIHVTLAASASPYLALHDTATVANNGSTDPNLGNNTSNTITTTVTTQADLAVTISGPASAPVGSTITYVIKVTDNGPSDAILVTLSDLLPAQTSFVSQTQGVGPIFQLSNGPTTVSDTIADLPSGATQTFSIKAMVKPPTANTFGPNAPSNAALKNTASVNSWTLDPNLSNNSASAVTPAAIVASPPVGAVVPATATPPPISAALIAYDPRVSGNGDLTINPDDLPAAGGVAGLPGSAMTGAAVGDVHASALEALVTDGGFGGPAGRADAEAMNAVAASLPLLAAPPDPWAPAKKS